MFEIRDSDWLCAKVASITTPINQIVVKWGFNLIFISLGLAIVFLMQACAAAQLSRELHGQLHCPH